MRVGLIRKSTREDHGVGRYAAELERVYKAAGLEVIVTNPVVPFPELIVQLIYRLLGWDLKEFFLNYPIWIAYPEAEIYHFTSQNLATLMIFHKPPGGCLVTVHDLINFDPQFSGNLKTPQDIACRFFEQIVLAGIRRTDFVISDSDFSRKVINRVMSDESPRVDEIYG
jgi:hypothetical protein